MKKLIIFALSLFVILTPAVSYAYETEEDCPECTGWMGNADGTTYDTYDECMQYNSYYGCGGIGNNITDGGSDGESGESGDGSGYYMCCDNPHEDPYTSEEDCEIYCGDPDQCTPGSDWNMACEDPDEPGYDSSDPCSEYTEDCEMQSGNDSYGFTWECSTGDYGRCVRGQSMGCSRIDFDINCDYLKNFVAGVNLGKIDVSGSDGGEYSETFLKACESNDWDCKNNIMDNACGYSEIIRAMGGADGGTVIPYKAYMYANENYGTSCYVPLEAALSTLDGICEYGPAVVNEWDEGSSCDDIDAWSACYEVFNEEKCEEFFSSHCNTIVTALNADFESSGDMSETRAKFKKWTATNCPTNVERCDYLYAAFRHYDDNSCDSPCAESGSLNYVCSQFGGYDTDEYKNCVNTLNNTFQCTNMIGNYSGDCGMDSYTDNNEPWAATDALLESGLSCFFAEFPTDGYNCVVLDAMLKSQLECSGYEDEETGEAAFDCWTEDSSWLSPYSSDTQMYLKQVVENISVSVGEEYYSAVEEARDVYGYDRDGNPERLEYAAKKLGITCKPLCDYQDIFDSIENNGYTGNACNIRNLGYYTTDSQQASRVLQYCADYNNLFSAYRDGYDPSAEITTIAGHACYDGRNIDVSDLLAHDCIYMQMFYDEYKNYDMCAENDVWGEELAWCIEDNIDDFADYICNGQSGATAIARCKYYIKNRAVDYTLIAEGFEVWDEDGNDIPINDFEDFTNYYGVTCADSCGERQYNKRGQCYDCELPTSKYEDFVNWTAGSTNCAHTYDTIENAGLKIYDLKCELADDFKNWDCTYNALECGGGYYDASGTQFQDGNYNDYSCNGDGFDGLGRPLCVDSSWQYECADYDEDGDCLVGLDFYYAYDLVSECGEPEYSDELEQDVYPCTNTISARAIDMLRCDTPVPMGYYGDTNFSQEGWGGNTKIACPRGDYQDETGKTSCKDCPAYGVKSTTNATVYGTTASTASTNITACQIPSTYSFKGGHGTYKFNPSCSYSK